MSTAGLPPYVVEDVILSSCETIAVIGLSADPGRDSHRVAAYMQQQGYRIVPINPRAPGPILGETVYASLTAVPDSIEIDLVNIFRRSVQTDASIDAAIERGVAAVWLQLGITNEAGLARAGARGMLAVQDRCLMVEHRRWQAGESGGDAGR